VFSEFASRSSQTPGTAPPIYVSTFPMHDYPPRST
jgi:hypothetical protein